MCCHKIMNRAAAALLASALLAAPALGSEFEGSSILSFGISNGLTPLFGESTLPTLRSHYEHFWNEDIAFGSTLTYAQSNFARVGSPEMHLYTLMIGGRGSYHFHRHLHTDWLDPYAGASAGYCYTALSVPGGYYSDYASSGSTFFALHAGARLALLPRMAGFVEVSNEMLNATLLADAGASLTAGLSFHF